MNTKPFWITIAREGETIDGRQIPVELLMDLDSSYDPQLYQARVWAGNGRRLHQLPVGDVNTTKIKTRGGATWLLALIQPNESFHSFFSLLSNHEMSFLPLYPRLEYFPSGLSEFGGKPYISGISAAAKQTFADLEPFNDHVVKHEQPIYRSI